ncbi:MULTISPECIES: ATP-binding protein [Mycobacteriaceae]|nr:MULTISPECIES: ATP-binding protein [Mycobacteriaceae]AHC24570.2 anti-sigma factor [Mycolicibacterium neoaurum VKM Ac-1815D]AMO08169.1 anti-sigma factor [Mycolicibacterium neoaurum]AXK78504.1 ATP-binding protein [Mycolicibacterium neoaurum]KJQ49324.1 anti-sigma factor [Mycolicibacterium neoaurum]KUM08592.1 anti-sigma factor [Mycolicibacterium neoaurum]
MVQQGTDADAAATDDDRSVELRVAATLENLAVLRVLIAAAATFEDLDFDAVSDLRLAVDEACTRLVKAAIPHSPLVVSVQPREDAVVITASATCSSDEDAIVAPGSFSWHVLSSLTDEVNTFSDGQHGDGGQIFGISLTARRASLLQ